MKWNSGVVISVGDAHTKVVYHASLAEVVTVLSCVSSFLAVTCPAQAPLVNEVGERFGHENTITIVMVTSGWDHKTS